MGIPHPCFLLGHDLNRVTLRRLVLRHLVLRRVDLYRATLYRVHEVQKSRYPLWRIEWGPQREVRCIWNQCHGFHRPAADVHAPEPEGCPKYSLSNP